MKKGTSLERNKTLFNHWAKNYDAPWFQFWMRRFQLPALGELILTPDTKILDCSCGTGEFLRKLQGKAQVYGLDISEEMLKIARRKLPAETKLQKADVHNLPFEDNFFDDVISTEAFHHYYDQRKALQEMVRVAKKGGKVIVVDLNFFLKPIHWLFERFEPGCVKVNDKQEMKGLFQQAELRAIRQKRNFGFAVMNVGEK